jgi:hypothetical protein
MAIDGWQWCVNPGTTFSGLWEGQGVFLGTGKPKWIRRSPEEWVAVAEELAKRNDGVLMTVGWLHKNGYTGLVAAMRKSPGLFSHITQERAYRTHDQWVVFAEELARTNGGLLQKAGWLYKNGYAGLYIVMRQSPFLFSHIPQAVIDNKSKQAMVRLNGVVQPIGGGE